MLIYIIAFRYLFYNKPFRAFGCVADSCTVNTAGDEYRAQKETDTGNNL